LRLSRGSKSKDTEGGGGNRHHASFGMDLLFVEGLGRLDGVCEGEECWNEKGCPGISLFCPITQLYYFVLLFFGHEDTTETDKTSDLEIDLRCFALPPFLYNSNFFFWPGQFDDNPAPFSHFKRS
jgi:hypothetical protein